MANRAVPAWALEEVSGGKWRDQRLRARAALMLWVMAEALAGTVSRCFRRVADREGAYRFLENESVTQEGLVAGVARATLSRVKGPWFSVALDFSFLSLPSVPAKAVGEVGDRVHRTAGLVAMTALAADEQGTVLGLADQQFHARKSRRARGASECPKCQARQAKRRVRQRRGQRVARSNQRCSHQVSERKALPLAEKETRFWLLAIERVLALCQTVALTAQPIFLCDRGADFIDLLRYITTHAVKAVVRATADRRLAEGRRVRSFLTHQTPVRYQERLHVPGTNGRRERDALVSVRAARVQLAVQGKPRLNVVWVHEHGPVPRGQARLDWLLWTTLDLRSNADVAHVVELYRRRWNIEVFHKTWKSVCQVEKTQLRSLKGLQLWATLQATVATRAQRLTQLARSQPALEALTEFSPDELLVLQSAILDRRKSVPAQLSLERAVLELAFLGGYTGKSSGGPPGAIVIARGLEELAAACRAIQRLRDAGVREI